MIRRYDPGPAPDPKYDPEIRSRAGRGPKLRFNLEIRSSAGRGLGDTIWGRLPYANYDPGPGPALSGSLAPAPFPTWPSPSHTHGHENLWATQQMIPNLLAYLPPLHSSLPTFYLQLSVALMRGLGPGSDVL